MGQKKVKIKIKCDDRISPALSELKFYLDSFRQFSNSIREFFLDIEKHPSKISKLIRVESAPATNSRTTTIVTFKPTDLFLDILTACRTGKFDNVFIESNHRPKTSTKGK